MTTPKSKNQKKKSGPALEKWPNYAGKGRPVKVDKLPLMAEPKLDIAASYARLVAHLESISDPGDQLACCESVFGSLVGAMQTGPGKNLRAGIVLALVAKSNYHLARKNQHKEALYKKKFTLYQSELLHQCNLGKSSTQVSRMRRAGELFIDLVEAKQPVPDTAERLIRLLPLKEKAKEVYIELAAKAGNKVPELSAIGEYVRSQPGSAKKKPAKVAEPTALLNEVQTLCATALINLKRNPPKVDAAIARLNRIVAALEAREPKDKDQTPPAVSASSESPAPVGSNAVDAAGGAKGQQVPDEKEEQWGCLIERYDNEVRLTRKPELMGSPIHVAHFINYTNEESTDWCTSEVASGLHGSWPEGQCRRVCFDVAAARECFRETVVWAARYLESQSKQSGAA